MTIRFVIYSCRPATRCLSESRQLSRGPPLYALPTIALFATVLAAVPLGIARHAIDLVVSLAATKIASRTRHTLREDATMQAALGGAEALLRSARAFLYEALEVDWSTVSAGQQLDIAQRTLLWLATTHAGSGQGSRRADVQRRGSASPYESNGIERCVRDIHAACQHVTLAPPNYEMAGQALGSVREVLQKPLRRMVMVCG